MRTIVITRAIVALVIMTTIMTSTGCASKKGAQSVKGGCSIQTELDSHHSQDARIINKVG